MPSVLLLMINKCVLNECVNFPLIYVARTKLAPDLGSLQAFSIQTPCNCLLMVPSNP